MAVLTDGLPLDESWTEVTAGLEMADGTKYVVEVHDAARTGLGHVVAVDTDDNVAPAADAEGHDYYPRTAAGEGTVRVFEKKTGHYWWMRTSGPAFTVVATAV